MELKHKLLTLYKPYLIFFSQAGNTATPLKQQLIMFRNHDYWIRPYSGESTSSRPIWEVKHQQARIVLAWVTSWEVRVLESFFKSFCFFFLCIWIRECITVKVAVQWSGLTKKKKMFTQFKPLKWSSYSSALRYGPWTVHCRSWELLCETSLARFTPFQPSWCPGLHLDHK